MGARGQVFLLSGPPGAGKSTVAARVLAEAPDLTYSVSFTTRQPRPGEQDGVHYHFVDRADFQRRIDSGEMLEYAEIFGNLYGTSAQVIRQTVEAGRDLFLDTDVNGAASIRRVFTDGVFIFLVPPSRAELERRLRGRGTETEDNIRQRLDRVAYELGQAKDYTHIVVNELVDQAVADVMAIIRTDRMRAARRLEMLKAEWGV